MIPSQYDPDSENDCVAYLRMSSDKQNPRSPDQQLATIKETIKRDGKPWRIVAVYRDDAISAKYTRRRPGYMAMVRDLKTKRVKANLVVVDTFERLTRADNASTHRERFRKMGLLVVTADTHFADPTTMQGKALAAFEEMRSAGDGKVKAHNVLRGKRDAVRQGHWPGGAPPFGYRLVFTEGVDRRRAGDAYSQLEPDPETMWIIQEAFRHADERGYGTNRVAKTLNTHPSVPTELKPLHPSTIGHWLDNPIYIGELVWGTNATEVIDDVRKKEPRPEEEWERFPGFCEPLVAREVWERVQALRAARGKRAKEAREREMPKHGIPGIHSPGIALKYPLTGLVRCQECGRAMTPSSSSPFLTRSGESKRYVAYTCPAYPSGICSNSKRIPEDWLREVVMDLIRRRLFLE